MTAARLWLARNWDAASAHTDGPATTVGLTCGGAWSRLGESNPRPTHYEGPSPPQPDRLPAATDVLSSMAGGSRCTHRQPLAPQLAPRPTSSIITRSAACSRIGSPRAELALGPDTPPEVAPATRSPWLVVLTDLPRRGGPASARRAFGSAANPPAGSSALPSDRPAAITRAAPPLLVLEPCGGGLDVV